jgi:hypothetical protein
MPYISPQVNMNWAVTIMPVLGILTNEFSAGSTVYFDPKKEWNFSHLFSYGLNSKKKNTKDNDITVGNLLSIEGGLGKTWV